MNNVDKTIDALCDWIQKELNSDVGTEKNTLTEMIKALAELVSTRRTNITRKLD